MSQDSLKKVLGDLEKPKPERQLRIHKDKDLEETVTKLLDGYWKSVNRGSKFNIENMRAYVPGFDILKISPDVIRELSARLDFANVKDTGLDVGYAWIGQLVQKSFEQKYNNFEIFINYPNQTVHFCKGLKGHPDRPLKISVVGDIDLAGFPHTKYIDVTIFGNVGEFFAWMAKYSSFDIRGNIFGISVGRQATNCIFKNASESVLNEIMGEADGHSMVPMGNKYYLLKGGKEIPYFGKKEK